MHVIDDAACLPSEAALEWSQTGPQGLPRVARVVAGNRNDDATKTLALSLAVVHRFEGAGEAVLDCDARFNFECAPFARVDDFGPKFEDLKIVAIRATSLSNRFLG